MLISTTVFLIKSDIPNSLAGHMNMLCALREIMEKYVRIEVFFWSLMAAITCNLHSHFFVANIGYGSNFLSDGTRLKKAFTITGQNMKFDSFFKDPLSEPLSNWGRYSRHKPVSEKKR